MDKQTLQYLQIARAAIISSIRNCSAEERTYGQLSDLCIARDAISRQISFMTSPTQDECSIECARCMATLPHPGDSRCSLAHIGNTVHDVASRRHAAGETWESALSHENID